MTLPSVPSDYCLLYNPFDVVADNAVLLSSENCSLGPTNSGPEELHEYHTTRELGPMETNQLTLLHFPYSPYYLAAASVDSWWNPWTRNDE